MWIEVTCANTKKKQLLNTLLVREIYVKDDPNLIVVISFGNRQELLILETFNTIKQLINYNYKG